MSKHPEKSGTSESKPAVKQPPAFCNGKHGYKKRKRKKILLLDISAENRENKVDEDIKSDDELEGYDYEKTGVK